MNYLQISQFYKFRKRVLKRFIEVDIEAGTFQAKAKINACIDLWLDLKTIPDTEVGQPAIPLIDPFT